MATIAGRRAGNILESHEKCVPTIFNGRNLLSPERCTGVGMLL